MICNNDASQPPFPFHLFVNPHKIIIVEKIEAKEQKPEKSWE